MDLWIWGDLEAMDANGKVVTLLMPESCKLDHKPIKAMLARQDAIRIRLDEINVQSTLGA